MPVRVSYSFVVGYLSLGGDDEVVGRVLCVRVRVYVKHCVTSGSSSGPEQAVQRLW